MSETEEVETLAASTEPKIPSQEETAGSTEPIETSEIRSSTPKSCSRQETEEEVKSNEDPPETRLGEPESILQLPKEESAKDVIEPVAKEAEKSDAIKPQESTEKEGSNPGRGSQESSSPGEDSRCFRNGSKAVGEWNSLPVLVERLRAALEVSLANRQEEDPPALPEDSGVDSEEDFRVRNSTERGVLTNHEIELKNDLKFLEDLLLSDIQTALSRLRETLERIDVVALAKHGAAGDPSSKLHLLKLVSSLLSRLQVPQDPPPVEKKPIEVPTMNTQFKKRRNTRHTIGVSTEELASARKWLEEEKERQNLFNSRKVEISRVPANDSVSRDEFHEKCTKDAINQRQALRDKNKESQGENSIYRGIIAQSSKEEVNVSVQNDQSNMYPKHYQSNIEDYQETDCPAENTEAEDSEEQSRVSKLAAALRQRAEMVSGRHTGNNKYLAKKSRIKRANTIDIPSYLKLQAETLGQENSGCVSLRRPINVGDKAGINSVNMVPSFQPKTENDRKFLALINRNTETPVPSQAPTFRPFGHIKPTESVANENWNSRFSNIKTTFDKSTNETDNKFSSKNKTVKRFPPNSGQVQPNPSWATKEKIFGGSYNNSSNFNNESSGPGFRHAPSSLFKKIEKSGVPLSPTKVPPAYHWTKNNAAIATNSLKEKAKLFDNVPSRTAGESQDTGFPRPPWIDNDRTEGRSNNSVTENGRLDYRSFCKQFAPFVGKGVDSKLRDFEEEKEREYMSHRRDSSSHGKVVDGKISFRMLPKNCVPSVAEPRRGELSQFVREKFSARNPTSYVEKKSDGRRDTCDREVKNKKSIGDATLRGSSSVAVQTGIHEEHVDEARSFRVTPKILKNQSLICNNASVQTDRDFTQSRKILGEGKTEWKSKCYEQRDSNMQPSSRSSQSRQFVLDHNQNYHVIPSDPVLPNDSLLPSRQDQCKVTNKESCFSLDPLEKPAFRRLPDYQKPMQYPGDLDQRIDRQNTEESVKSHREPPVSAFVSTNSTQKDRPEDQKSDLPQRTKDMDWRMENSKFLDDENIQNQDISPEVGIITRYTCAIGTVESVDSPEPRSEEAGPVDSRTPSSPSPSQSWSRSRPPTNGTTTPEDEIRRHNLLQQSLVRRLQNEKTSLNENTISPTNFSPVRSPNLNSTEIYDQRYQQTPEYYLPPIAPASYQESVPPIQVQSPRFLSPNVGRNLEQHPRVPSPTGPSIPVSFQESVPSVPGQSSRFLSPNVGRNIEQHPRVPSPTGPSTVNRIIALREAYEHAPAAHPKPMQKERSPIPNGVNDSSDEYLVSCASKPSRSIVLSKSESWHQLAQTNSYPKAARLNVPSTGSSSSSQNSCLPKPPKPKSPSTQKLRSKQFEASSAADSVKKMEEKIRRYFDGPTETLEVKETRSRRSSPRNLGKGLVGLTRSRTMPGICDEKLRITIPTVQLPLLNVNTADVDKVFDDLFEEVTRTDRHQC